ncbi:MAG: RNA polymerase sigma factor [Planctomycetota bacterium]|nr:RNA polymerase sigma factor [Planctomycetota bacterium]
MDDLPHDLQAAQARDRAAFDRVADAHRAYLADLVRAFVPHPADADDVLQQVLMRAWLDLPGLQEPSSFRYWLGTLARRACVRFLQARRRDARIVAVEDPSRLPDRAAPAPHEDGAALREALASAPRKLRAIAEAFYAEGRSVREIAAQASCPEGTVKRRLFEARSYLRTQAGLPALPRKEFRMHQTLDAALQDVSARLTADGHTHYVPLVRKDMVVAAIKRGWTKYEKHYAGPRGRAFIDNVIKPMLDGITEHGRWPAEAKLEYFFTVDGEVPLDGFSLGIEIETPGEEYRGFSLPIVDLWYGSWGEETP